MNRNEIMDVVREKLSLYLGESYLSIEFTEPLLNVGEELDSITMIQILVELESELDFDFDDEQLISDTFCSIDSLTNAVMVHIKN